MKKSLIVLICICLTALCGCSAENEFTAENHSWKFAYVQSGESGDILYASEESQSVYDGEKVIDLSCTAENGIITITNDSTGEAWKIAYTVNNTLGESTVYDITYNGISGNAAVGKTTYLDESFEYTFVIVIDGYSLCFTD
ncbi:MAG: hypothetical protein IJZ35_01100 [Clostridia bacterium]|nr:hypothetical protein [Clostridia bacterium]